MGLFISKGIVEQHGGRIWATSRGPGKGSTFSFSLPLAEALPRPDRPEARRGDVVAADRPAGPAVTTTLPSEGEARVPPRSAKQTPVPK